MKTSYFDYKGHSKATISWKAPRKWRRDEGITYFDCRYGNGVCIYRFDRKYATGIESIYLGVTDGNSFHKKFPQHKDILRKIKGQVWVSVGKIDSKKSKHLKQTYKDLRDIFVHFWSFLLLNPDTKKWSPLRIRSKYIIENKGYKGSLPRSIVYPVSPRFPSAGDITF